MKTRFYKKHPTEEGWYWVKYKGKNGMVLCPAAFTFFRKDPNDWACQTARNDLFLPFNQEDLKFGPKIEFPE